MYSYEDRIRAVELFIKLGKRTSPPGSSQRHTALSMPRGLSALAPGCGLAQLCPDRNRPVRGSAAHTRLPRQVRDRQPVAARHEARQGAP